MTFKKFILEYLYGDLKTIFSNIDENLIEKIEEISYN